MMYFALAVVVLFSLLMIGLMAFIFFKERERLQTLMVTEKETHREQRINWERERERLMNRVMVKEWTTYAQMTQAMSQEEEPSPRGMSDDEEVRRYMDSLGQTPPNGLGEETLVDFASEMNELGIA
jgi:hypothetical protein